MRLSHENVANRFSGAVFYANRGGGVGIAPTYIIPDETGR